MPAPFDTAFAHIGSVVSSLLPGARMTRVGSDKLYVESGEHRITIPFNHGALEDLENALSGSQPVRYANGIKNDVRYGLLIVLGLEGLIPQVKLSSEVIAEERDWHRNVTAQTRFTEAIAKGLYGGLLDLRSALKATLNQDIDMPEVRAELEVIRILIEHYDTQKHLNNHAASTESLSYLKAAALCWIYKLEDEKAKALTPRSKAAFDAKIYDIFRDFWGSQPMNWIRLPPAIQDFAAQRTQSVVASKAAHHPQVDIGPQLEKLDPQLKSKWQGAWNALRSDNPDRVSQAANSMVEVLDKTIARVCGGKEFKEYLTERQPDLADAMASLRRLISDAKAGLHRVKHHPNEQSPQLAEDLMHLSEWLIQILLRQ